MSQGVGDHIYIDDIELEECRSKDGWYGTSRCRWSRSWQVCRGCYI